MLALGRAELSARYRGEIPERSKGADCKSAAVVLRRFESSSPHHPPKRAAWARHDSRGGPSGRAAERQSAGRKGDGGCGEAPAAGWFLTPAGCRERGSSSGVEHQPSKLRVAGSNPVSRSMASFPGPRGSVVEHFLGKEGVTGSIPVVGSTFRTDGGRPSAPGFTKAAGLGPAVSGGSKWARRNSRGRSRT